MNLTNQSPLWKVVIAITLATLVASCQPTAPPAQNVGDGEIQDIRVHAAEPVKTTSKVEQFPLPNCGGSDKLGQSLGSFASVSKSATVGAKATVTGGGEVAIPETAKLKLEIQVELAYQQTFETANSRLDTIEMSAAAGTHVVYTIIWEEQTFNSIVEYSSDGKVYSAPYTYMLSVPKIDRSYNVVCDENSEPGNITATQAPPLPVATTAPPVIIIIHPTSVPTAIPPTEVPPIVVPPTAIPTPIPSSTPIPSRDPFTIPGSAVLCDGDAYSGDCEGHSFAGQDVCINLGGINDRANSFYFTGEYQGNFDVVFYRDSNCNTYLARYGSAASSFGLINDQFSSIAFYYYR